VSDNNNVGASMGTGGFNDRRTESGDGSARAPARADDHRDQHRNLVPTTNACDRPTPGDGVGIARLEAEGEIALARLVLDVGDPAAAATHVAAALEQDPTLPDAYEMLRVLDVEPPRARDYFPLYDGVSPGSVAARSYLAARAGQFTEALDLLAIVAAAAPGKTWTASGWLDMPGIAAQVEPAAAAESLLCLALHLDEPVDPDLLPVLAPYLDFGRRLVEAHDERIDVLAPLSGLARRLGATREAISWCERADRTSPSGRTAIMLGYAYRAAGRFDDMFAIWRTAVQRDPTNVDIQVDLAEHLDRAGRPNEALKWLEHAIGVDPSHHKALPTACELRYREDRDVDHLIRLVDHWRSHPDHAYAGDRLARACDGRPWLRFVPAPTEPWQHDAVTAQPAVAPASAAAVARLHEAASAAWAHPIGAYDRASRFAGLPLDDLLGLLVHVPPAIGDNWRTLERTDLCDWPRLAQAYVCLGLLHHRTDQPWPVSTRRRVLVDIVNGVEDWTTDAATFALVTAAWLDPLARTDVATLVSRRFAAVRKAMRHRPVSIANSMASLVLLTPGIDETVRRHARQLLAADQRPSGDDGFAALRSRRVRFGRHRHQRS
jgi:tetratricopeptide (TPR) repeat protein